MIVRGRDTGRSSARRVRASRAILVDEKEPDQHEVNLLRHALKGVRADSEALEEIVERFGASTSIGFPSNGPVYRPRPASSLVPTSIM